MPQGWQCVSLSYLWCSPGLLGPGCSFLELKQFRALQLSQWLFLSQPSSLRLYQPLSAPKHSPCAYKLGEILNWEPF